VAEARLLSVGSYKGPPASVSESAQKLFNQGIVFGWGFNGQLGHGRTGVPVVRRRDPDEGSAEDGIAGPEPLGAETQPLAVPPEPPPATASPPAA